MGGQIIGGQGASPPAPVDLQTIRPTSLADPNTAPSATSVSKGGTFNDQTRKRIAYALLALLAALIVFHFIQSSLLTFYCADSTKPALCTAQTGAFSLAAKETQNIFTALVGLVGSVVGFYFGQKSNENPQD